MTKFTKMDSAPYHAPGEKYNRNTQVKKTLKALNIAYLLALGYNLCLLNIDQKTHLAQKKKNKPETVWM